MGYSPWGWKRVRHDWACARTHTHTHTHTWGLNLFLPNSWRCKFMAFLKEKCPLHRQMDEKSSSHIYQVRLTSFKKILWVHVLSQISMVIDTYTIVLHFWVVFSRQMIVVTVQLISQVLLFVTSWTAACQASLSLSILQSLFKLMSIESVIPSNHLILCRPLLLLPSIFPIIRVFSSEWWPKYWRFSFSISPSNEYSGLNSLKIDWFDLTKIDDKS